MSQLCYQPFLLYKQDLALHQEPEIPVENQQHRDLQRSQISSQGTTVISIEIAQQKAQRDECKR